MHMRHALGSPARKRGTAITPIEWNDYPRIPPGEYSAYCAWAGRYYDRAFKRWTCLQRFDVLRENGTDVVARIPMWLSLGNGEKPRASRRSNYLKEWVKANGGPPVRSDRLSSHVFVHRIARVEVGDTTKGPVPYSVVKKILRWETGGSGSLSHQVTQSRTAWVNPSRKKELSEVNGKKNGFGPSRGRGRESLHHHTQGAGVPFSVRPSKATQQEWRLGN